MKNYAKILWLTLLLAVSMLLATACGGGGEIEISVKADSMPQLQFVLGEELDFSKGVLEVKENDTTTDLPLSSEEITVSGYDKNELGEQTVTIEYKGKTVELTVTVVDRMLVLEHTPDYLIGDAFDASKGRLKITRNDGTSYTVPLSNKNVTIEGFSSDSAKSGLTLTASYASGEDKYTASFTVNVYGIESVELHKPNKVAYNSHEGGLDISGGYLTLKGNSGKLSKDVAITADMVSGFNLGAVNKDNTPLTQTLTVTYDNKPYTYDVKLVYTDISLFNESAKSYASLIWTGSTLPTITDEQGVSALDMIDLYLDMSKAERSYISTADALSVARAAMAYGYVKWTDEILKYSNVFTMADDGSLMLICKSYTDVKNSIANITDTNSPFYTIAPLLIKMSEEFGKESLITNLTFADCLVLDSSTISNAAAELKYMLELHEKFALIEDWNAETVVTHEAAIKDIYSFITSSLYNDSTASQLYAIVSSWREKNDAFDILYSYYFAKNDMDTVTALAALRLPGELQVLFDNVTGAFNQISQIAAYNVFDTSGFFYYYYKAVELSAELKNTENTIIKELYDTLPLNGLLGITDTTTQYTFDTLIEYFRTANAGSFQYYSASMLGIDKYHALIDTYVSTLIKVLDVANYTDTAEYGEAIKSMFNMYVELTPTQQLNFLSTVNAYYNVGYPPLAFDDNSDYYDFTGMFTKLINGYIKEQLPTEAASAAYDNLVLAMEIYAQRTSYTNWLKEFKSRMDSVISTYDAMSAADKAIFDGLLSSAYNKYVGIRQRYNDSTTSTDLGVWKDSFDALEEAIVNIDNAYYLLEEGYPVYSLLFSAFERANAIVENILANAPDEIKAAYYYDELYIIPADVTGDVELSYSYEYMLNFYRGIYIDCLCGYFGGSTNYYDAYNELELGKFLDKTYELVWTFAWEEVFKSSNATPPIFDRENTIALMKEFRNLDRDSQVLFTMIEGDYGLYYSALVKFIAESLGTSAEDAAVTAYDMIELEQLILFTDPEDATAVAELEAALTGLEESYNALTGETKAAFADFEEIYLDIVSDCRAMIDSMNNAD